MDMILSCSTQCFTYILVNGIFLQNPGFVGLSGYGSTIAVGRDVVRNFSPDNSVSYAADMGQFHRE